MNLIFRLTKVFMTTVVCLAFAGLNAQTSLDYEAWKAASASNPYDVTQLMVNPTGTGNTGWSRNPSDAAAGYNKHNSEFASSIYDDTGIESWYWNPVKSADLIWQDVKGIQPGTYRVKAYVVAQIYNNSSRKGQCGNGSYFFAGSEKAAITSNKWQVLTLTATVDDSQTLRIGICADENNENDWVSIAQVKVECIGFSGITNPRKMVLDERYDVSAAHEGGIYDVSLHKTFTAGKYTTFCVPFKMSADMVSEYFDEVRYITGITVNGDNFKLITATTKVINPGTPYLVRAKVGGRQTIEVKEVSITPLNEVQPVVRKINGLGIVTSYRTHEAVQDAYILADDGTTMVKSDKPVKVTGYSFYGLK